ncbi:cAMP-activated global transcriptional regulator CRP [Flavobacterium bizetiae]|uniref:cAMP-activated global transcriptional regulator CRP n=1 Tax=Flavobacterium bizetiae TaxID=2704140 RepID=A0A6J4G9I2_9FLAO|nr:Crp/Fnr family transcriptional regulator [Flavobacterium bizetiae]CAA9195019.1 cAMP-activated global transcriptional regulator CRP [Flavobacterium bizetiae]CAD5340931.1 cAMP-activated global transcriptional regulator CRP [Flavobacterium bizetiae]CAD5347388.1 cAMP-activated global transcriptional regulator CRP [Flavobacterium bizetiae]
MIAIDLLEKYGALKKTFDKNDFIFEEGNLPTHYYQIISGEVKMSNYNDEGREFIQGIFYKEQSFGEPPLFLNQNYPANAIAVEDAEILLLPKDNFMKLLQENAAVSIKIIENLAQRLYYKSVMAAEMSTQEPEHRILKLIDHGIAYFNFKKEENGYLINFTRQQIGDLTGLRVETVIRTIKALEKKGVLKIINRKVYR